MIPPAPAERSPSPLGEPLVDAEAVATFLGVDKATVHRLAGAADGIPVVQVSARVRRFRPQDVRAWVERRRRESPGGRSRVARLLGDRRG